MLEPDEFENSACEPALMPVRSFWSTIQWRLGSCLIVTMLTGIVFFVLALFNARHILDIPAQTIGSMFAIAFLYLSSRVLWAWVEWPSEFRVVRAWKAVLRYFLFDVEGERRAASDTNDPTGPADSEPESRIGRHPTGNRDPDTRE